jgi:DNA repair protein RadA
VKDPLEELPGVGRVTASKLRDIGVNSIDTLAMTPIHEITSRTDINYNDAMKFVLAARERMGWGFMTAKELWEKRKTRLTCTTGCSQLDNLLEGGIRTQEMVELIGEYGTGKTTICFKLCITGQQPPEKGGLGGSVLFFDTEGTFSPKRIRQIAEAMELEADPVLSGIIISRAYTSDHQEFLLDHAFDLCEKENVKLVIVDSVIAHYRSEYVGRESLAERQQRLNRYMHKLHRLSEIYDLAVVITNQAQASPQAWYLGGGGDNPAGGHILGHACTHRIFIRKSSGSKRVAKMLDSPYIPYRECVFIVSEKGIEDP